MPLGVDRAVGRRVVDVAGLAVVVHDVGVVNGDVVSAAVEVVDRVAAQGMIYTASIFGVVQCPGGVVNEVALDGGPGLVEPGPLLGPQIPDVELAASFLAFGELSLGGLAIALLGTRCVRTRVRSAPAGVRTSSPWQSLMANAKTTTSRTATTTTKMITVGSIGHLLGPSATSLWCCPSLSIPQMTHRDVADDARRTRPVRPPTAAPEPGAAATTLAGTGIEPSNRPLAQITSSTTVRLVRRARRPRLLRRQFRVVPGTAYGRARVGWSTQVGKGLIGSG